MKKAKMSANSNSYSGIVETGMGILIEYSVDNGDMIIWHYSVLLVHIYPLSKTT